MRRPHPSLLCYRASARLQDRWGLGGSSTGLGPGSGKVTGHPALPHLPCRHSQPRASLVLTSLLSLSEVGRPGAHRLVRVLHPDHEVSALSPLLCCLTPGSIPAAAFRQSQKKTSVSPFSHFWPPVSPGDTLLGQPRWERDIQTLFWGTVHIWARAGGWWPETEAAPRTNNNQGPLSHRIPHPWPQGDCSCLLSL